MRNLLAATALVVAAGPALAGGTAVMVEDPVIAPAPVIVAPSVDWTGGYAGVQLGWGMATIDDGVPPDDDGDGVIGGVTVGYDYDFGNFVVGGALDYDFSEIEFDSGATIDNVARVKVRAGIDAGRTLIYGVGGAAFANATVGGADLSDNGWVAGAGVEHRVTDTFSVGGEVLYHQFDDFDGSGADVNATTIQAKALFRF